MTENRVHETTLAALARHFMWYDGEGRLLQVNAKQCEPCFWENYPTKMKRFKSAPKSLYQTTFRRIHKWWYWLRSRMIDVATEELYWRRLRYIGEERIHEWLQERWVRLLKKTATSQWQKSCASSCKWDTDDRLQEDLTQLLQREPFFKMNIL